MILVQNIEKKLGNAITAGQNPKMPGKCTYMRRNMADSAIFEHDVRGYTISMCLLMIGSQHAGFGILLSLVNFGKGMSYF